MTVGGKKTIARVPKTKKKAPTAKKAVKPAVRKSVVSKTKKSSSSLKAKPGNIVQGKDGKKYVVVQGPGKTISYAPFLPNKKALQVRDNKKKPGEVVIHNNMKYVVTRPANPADGPPNGHNQPPVMAPVNNQQSTWPTTLEIMSILLISDLIFLDMILMMDSIDDMGMMGDGGFEENNYYSNDNFNNDNGNGNSMSIGMDMGSFGGRVRRNRKR